MEIPPLQQTSEGAERISVVSFDHSEVSIVSKAGAPFKASKQTRSDDEMKLITSTLERFKGRPPERIAAALQEEGITIKAAELKRYMKA